MVKCRGISAFICIYFERLSGLLYAGFIKLSTLKRRKILCIVVHTNPFPLSLFWWIKSNKSVSSPSVHHCTLYISAQQYIYPTWSCTILTNRPNALSLLYIAFYWIELYSTLLHCIAMEWTWLHCTVMYFTALWCISLHCTVLYGNDILRIASQYRCGI